MSQALSLTAVAFGAFVAIGAAPGAGSGGCGTTAGYRPADAPPAPMSASRARRVVLETFPRCDGCNLETVQGRLRATASGFELYSRDGRFVRSFDLRGPEEPVVRASAGRYESVQIGGADLLCCHGDDRPLARRAADAVYALKRALAPETLARRRAELEAIGRSGRGVRDAESVRKRQVQAEFMIQKRDYDSAVAVYEDALEAEPAWPEG